MHWAQQSASSFRRLGQSELRDFLNQSTLLPLFHIRVSFEYNHRTQGQSIRNKCRSRHIYAIYYYFLNSKKYRLF